MIDLVETPAVVALVNQRKRIQFRDEDDYRRQVDTLVPGLCLTVRIEEEQDSRPKSDKQRGYWFAVPVPILADEIGCSDKEASRDLMGECFGYEMNRFGKLAAVESSFAALTVTKANELIDWVQDWGPRHYNVIIPPPDKDWKKHAATIQRERMRLKVNAALVGIS